MTMLKRRHAVTNRKCAFLSDIFSRLLPIKYQNIIHSTLVKFVVGPPKYQKVVQTIRVKPISDQEVLLKHLSKATHLGSFGALGTTTHIASVR
ncbi:hypothetical protein Zmor_019373 [Zophobas morio]|uniref:Uncharacterized protein n=1 Tax=Zophobas morio TaxID=2755281 RepID=A0AA38M939_9CUCU|nr:hypothetical protein Zmor_019373 [Zophobas morio]